MRHLATSVAGHNAASRTRASLAEEVTLVRRTAWPSSVACEVPPASSFGEFCACCSYGTSAKSGPPSHGEDGHGPTFPQPWHTKYATLCRLLPRRTPCSTKISDPRLKRLTFGWWTKTLHLEDRQWHSQRCPHPASAGRYIGTKHALALTTRRICSEWAQQNMAQQRLSLVTAGRPPDGSF